jgi:DNA-directed RNA polymerase subunit M/transcription elongation factor TFIIS
MMHTCDHCGNVLTILQDIYEGDPWDVVKCDHCGLEGVKPKYERKLLEGH